MNILVTHNSYLQAGGEEGSLEEELKSLRFLGHEVSLLRVSNDEVRTLGLLRTSLRTLFSMDAYRAVRRRMVQERAQLLLVNNFFPLLSPSIFFAARDIGVPSVLYLRNYRLACAAATLSRSGSICHDCIEARSHLPAIRHRCYRGSIAGSAVVASMLHLHRLLRTWDRVVSRYVALSHFQKGVMVSSGTPEHKVLVKPNYLSEDPGPSTAQRRGIVYVGRIASEKGIVTLLSAWRQLAAEARDMETLTILGDGPLRPELMRTYAELPGVIWRGRVGSREVLDAIGEARCLVFPSTWYEGMPRTIIEAFATGTPVIASGIGTMAEMVVENVNGRTTQPSNVEELARMIWSTIAERRSWEKMQVGARESYCRLYSGTAGLDGLRSMLAALTEQNTA